MPDRTLNVKRDDLVAPRAPQGGALRLFGSRRSRRSPGAASGSSGSRCSSSSPASPLVVTLAHVLGDRLVEGALLGVPLLPGDRQEPRAARLEEGFPLGVDRIALLGSDHERLDPLAGDAARDRGRHPRQQGRLGSGTRRSSPGAGWRRGVGIRSHTVRSPPPPGPSQVTVNTSDRFFDVQLTMFRLPGRSQDAPDKVGGSSKQRVDQCIGGLRSVSSTWSTSSSLCSRTSKSSAGRSSSRIRQTAALAPSKMRLSTS